MDNENRQKFDALVGSMKPTEAKSGLLSRTTSGATESSQVLGQKAMKEVMDKAAADKQAALQVTGPGLKNRV